MLLPAGSSVEVSFTLRADDFRYWGLEERWVVEGGNVSLWCEITRDHSRSLEISRDHSRSLEITRDHSRSLEISRDRCGARPALDSPSANLGYTSSTPRAHLEDTSSIPRAHLTSDAQVRPAAATKGASRRPWCGDTAARVRGQRASGGAGTSVRRGRHSRGRGVGGGGLSGASSRLAL